MADVKGLLGRHVPQTRQMLRKLLDGQILCTPFTDARGKGYEITATGSYAGLFRVPVAVNDGGGEGGILPSLTDALRFNLHALAIVA